MNDATRLPVVAGSFYPADKDELFETIHQCFTHRLGPGAFPSSRSARKGFPTECLIVPHAGYDFSGPVAAHSYNVAFEFFHTAKNNAKSVIIVGPNHYGIGSGVTISRADSWETPLGTVRVDQQLSKELQHKCELIDRDDTAHSREHSIEVQLPFLQAISGCSGNWSFLPISLMMQDSRTATELGNAIFEFVVSHKGSFLIIGSSDLTHYENQEQAARKDSMLLRQTSALDLQGFYTVLQRENITACGYGAIATLMQIAKRLGRSRGELLKYSTSGDVTGEKSSVVGYSSMRFV
jgi:AmmeMemoRadiSam system protein B